MSKEKFREAVKALFDGKCAFCGHDLGKGWHIWDINPVATIVDNNGALTKVNTEIENMLPACKPCGSLRIRSTSHKMDIEEFRQEVKQSFDFLRYGGITSTSYGRSIRFGLIVETGADVVFHFEQIQKPK